MSKRILVSFVAVLALAVMAIAGVSAATNLNGTGIVGNGVVEVNNVDGSNLVGIFAGETFPVRIEFKASQDDNDVRVKAEISGESSNSVVTERFDVLGGSTYSRVLTLRAPFDIKPNEIMHLEISIESRNGGTIGSATVDLKVQRDSYLVEVLDVDMPTEVSSGDMITLDVVLKNRGSQEATDSFVRATIPALGITDKGYFGDLSAVDNSTTDKSDANERRLFLKIPANTPAGIYEVEIQAYNDDSVTTITRKFAVSGVLSTTEVVSSVHSQSVAVGKEAEYSITLVNSGDTVRVYEFVVEGDSALRVDLSDPVVAVPAGTSKTVKIGASANKAGTYNFAVNLYSGSDLVKKESFATTVEGTNLASATVLLTVILAIIFVVLLVVLIVLLTRKPVKAEEFGESYY